MSAPLYIFGNGQSCERTTNEPVIGQVKGKIPKWLEGKLICNGPGIFNVGNDRYDHAFDGLAVLHRFNFQNGQVTYSSRALESDTYKKNMKAERIVVSEFGTASFPDPCKTFLERLRSRFSVFTVEDEGMTDNCNVSVGYYGDQLYAMTETNLLRQIDPKDLRTIGEKTRINDYVAVNQATAHPHILEDGSIFNMGNNYRHKRGPHYCIFKLPASVSSIDDNDNEKTEHSKSRDQKQNQSQELHPSSNCVFKDAKLVAEIPCSSRMYPSYYHSFGVTEKYIVFIESPLRIDVLKVLKGRVMGQPISSALFWDSNIKTKFHVVSLEDGKRLPFNYESEPFFTLHHINAYEDKEKGSLIVDIAGYDTGSVILSIVNTKAHRNVVNAGRVRRFILPLQNDITQTNSSSSLNQTQDSHKEKQGKEATNSNSSTVFQCSSTNLTNDWMDFPRINYKYNGRCYNFFYALENSDKDGNDNVVEANVVAKVDIKRRQVKRWSEMGKLPSEPIFIANPSNKKDSKGQLNPEKEDDGVILTTLLHKNEASVVTLVILGAKEFKEIARVTFKTSGTFTGAFHGTWANSGDKIHGF